ncbi:MAG: glycosyltransferase family 2 protein [Parcubacteria group bacterium]|jgi:glycosyltransferase involved in cell wall biosynthesis
MKIAVLIPCYNEEKTIEKVISDFKTAIPLADIYVYDNNSKDKTYDIAVASGAIVKKEPRQGKGFVVQKMFREIDADIYVLVDGDDTYPAENVMELIERISEGADMVVGDRLSNGTYEKENKRGFHNFGNNLVRSLVNMLFKSKLRDIMSGYRIFSRDFVKNYPVLVGGFQLETDMTIFALDRDFVVREVPIVYRDRPVGSVSKLNTFSDGIKVIMVIFNLFRYYRPFLFFSLVSVAFVLLGLIIGFPVIVEYLESHFIAKVPSAILAASLMLLSALSFISGVILDALTRVNKEIFQLKLKK